MKMRAFPFLFFILSACSSVGQVAPILPPDSILEQKIDEAASDALFQENSKIPDEWWLIFEDEQLTEFIQKALLQNPSLQSVEMKIQKSASLADRLKSSLYPNIFLGADVSRQKLSETGVIPFQSGAKDSNTPIIQVPTTPGGTARIPKYFTLYETEFNLKYEFDFWHKNRNTFRAALGKVQADIAEYAYAKLELAIAIAKTYYALQTDYERQKIAEKFIENRLHFRDLVQKRIHAHIDTDLSLQNAESQVIDAKDLKLQIDADIAVNQIQLNAYLAGNFDEDIKMHSIAKHSLPKVPLPNAIPLNLVSKRPDITAQLWLIESANWQVEVAKAGFYPDFNLSAFFGFQTIHFAELLKWPSTFFNVDPALTLPIFDGGRLIANLEGSQIDYNLAVLQYNQLVINAAQDVLQSLAVLRNQWNRFSEFELKVEVQAEYFRLMRLRVNHNLSSEIDALASEEIWLRAQDQEVRAQGRTINAILELINALGGGYDSECIK